MNEFIKEIEWKFGVTYVGYYDIPLIDNVYVFWQPNPKLGHSNYLAVYLAAYKNFRKLSTYTLTDGKSIEDVEYNALEDNGKFVVSRYRHDFVKTSDDRFVDGGIDYTKTNTNITHKMVVRNGKETFKEVDLRDV